MQDEISSATSPKSRPQSRPKKRSQKPRYDLVLYGASGFVGRQTVRYIAEFAQAHPGQLRWAVAGRNADKLAQVLADCGSPEAGVIVADAEDAPALAKLAKSAAVVLSTAGPFALYGSALVAACVTAKTDYVDITGESPWIAGLIERHHEQAAQDGTRIVPCCGFDSVPSDLGALLMQSAMQERHALPCVQVKSSFSIRGGFNGGTLASVFNIMASGQGEAFSNPFLLNPQDAIPADLRPHVDPSLPRFDSDFNAWLGPFLMGPINTRIVRRSAALAGIDSSFRYQEYLRVGRGPVAGAVAAALSVGMGAGMLAMAVGPLRRGTQMLAPKPGQGPSERSMDAGSFRCEWVGESAAGQKVRGRMLDQGDPGNRATTKFVCESALCLALERAALPGGPRYGGILTPATALGEVLVKRLKAAGMTVEVDAA